MRVNLRSATLLAAASLLVAATSAQTLRQFQPVSPSQVEMVEPTAWAPIDAEGNVIGSFQPFAFSAGRSAIWQYAFDSMNSQANNLPATGTTPSSLQTLWFIPGNYRAYGWVNDIAALNTGMLGQIAKGVYLGFYWNPAGTTTPSGTLNFAARIYTARRMDLTGDGPAFVDRTSGVMVTVANLSVGTSAFKAIPFNFSTTGAALPLPAGASPTSPAALIVEFGTYTGTNFETFNPIVVCSPLFGNMRAPGEPRFPGANVSRSGELYWADDANPFNADNTPSYTFEDFTNTLTTSFPFSELYTGDTELDPDPLLRRGIIQPASALYVDTNAKRITGVLNFQEVADPTRLPKMATFEIRNSSTDAVLSTQTVHLGAGNTFTLADPNPYAGGTYVIRYLQQSVHLARRSGVVNTTGGLSTAVPTLNLFNGDVDQSGEVDLTDIDIAIGNYLTNLGPEAGNVDYSEEVDLTDIDIIIGNYLRSGE